jgi:outer membrane immunogenic protein
MRHSRATFLLTAAAISFGSAGSVHAADMPFPVKAPPMPSCAWCGWYAGANGGYGWGDATGSISNFSTTPNNVNFGPPLAAGAAPTFLGIKPEGGFGGGQFGYNWVMSNWLLGVEADLQGANIGHATTIVFPGAPEFDSTLSAGRDHIDWFGTARGRLGMTFGNVLFYGTAGLAYGGVSSAVSDRDTSPAAANNFTGSTRETRFGWAAGAGAEWMFAPKWSVKTEYLHVDLGSSNTTMVDPVNAPGAFATYRFRHEFDSARVGVNYHLGGPIVAKY